MTSAICLLGANDLHRKITSYNPKCIFGSSFSSASEPEMLEHRTAPYLMEAEHRGQEERPWQPHAQSWGREIGWERVWQPQPHWLLREA
jgi:hypothetical protein